MKRLLLPVFVVALVAVAPVGTLAGGGGTLAVSPASVPLGSTFTLSGTGYPVPTAISFEVSGPRKADPPIHYFTAGEPLGTDSGGSFSQSWVAWWAVAGDYQITSYYRDSKGGTHKVAVVKFTVTP